MRTAAALCSLLLALAAAAAAGGGKRRKRADSYIDGLRVAEHLVDGFRLTWDHPDAANVHFTVRHRVYNDQGPLVQAPRWAYVESPTNTVYLTGLRLRATYEMQARAASAEGDGAALGDWSPPLLATVRDPSVAEVALPTPTEFGAHVYGPESVFVDWRYDTSVAGVRQDDVYYKLKVFESSGGERTLVFNLNVLGEAYIVNELRPGSTYHVELQAALSPTESSPAVHKALTVPLVGRVPHADVVDVGHAALERHGSAHTVFWPAPAPRTAVVSYYICEYRTDGGWWQRSGRTRAPNMTLHSLLPNTNYLLRVVTGARVDCHVGPTSCDTSFVSNAFRMQTKVSPVSMVNISFEAESRGVAVQWWLSDAVDRRAVGSYELLYTDSEDAALPEERWRAKRVTHPADQTRLDNLQPNVNYRLRLVVVLKNGDRLKSASVYPFKIFDYTRDLRNAVADLYVRPTGPGSVEFRWTPPGEPSDDLRGYMFMFSPDRRSPWEQWGKILIMDMNRRRLNVNGLRAGAEYYVKLVPRIDDKFTDPGLVDTFPVLVPGDDDGERTVGNAITVDDAYGAPEGADGGNVYLRLSSCRVSHGAAACRRPADRCVPQRPGADAGWCIDEHIVQAARRADDGGQARTEGGNAL